MGFKLKMCAVATALVGGFASAPGATTYFVNAVGGDDSYAGTSPQEPKASIQAAVSRAVSNDTIRVAPGTYGPINVTKSGVDIISDAGATKTVIDGGGTNRCVTFEDTAKSRLVGFTLTGGDARQISGSAPGGGVRYGRVESCIITNNLATRAAAAYSSELHDCIVAYNYKTSNYDYYAADQIESGTLVGCTVIGIKSSRDIKNATCRNCLLLQCDTSTCSIAAQDGNLVYGSDDCLAAPQGGDFRVRAGTAADGGGVVGLVETEYDVFGNARVQGGAVEVGAVEGAAAGVRVLTPVCGIGRVSGGNVCREPGSRIVLKATETDRKFVGWTVDYRTFVSTSPELEWTVGNHDQSVAAVFDGLHVDGANGNDANDGYGKPKATIQAAIDVSHLFESIFVAPGTYSAITDGQSRVLFLFAEKGPGETVIDGAGKTTCVSLSGSWIPSYAIRGRSSLVGFTVQNGRPAENMSSRVGGVSGGYLRGCVLRQNRGTGVNGGLGGEAGASASRLYGCRLESNIGDAAYGCELYDCILANNQAVDSAANNCHSVNCTFYNNKAWFDGGDIKNGSATNVICLNSTYTTPTASVKCTATNHIYFGNPGFADAKNGQFQLMRGSPCVDAGLDGFFVSATDFDGKDRVQGKSVDIGAIEGEHVFVMAKVLGSGAVDAARKVVLIGEKVPFTAIEGARRFVGWSTDGTSLVSSAKTFAFGPCEDEFTVYAQFQQDLYVDAAAGNDASDGLDPARAMRTVQAAINASLPGDVIHLAAGTYRSFASSNRQVTVVGDAGAARTFIDGGRSDCCARLGDSASNTNTTLVGLTLLNGAAEKGGGVCFGQVEACVISNCTARGEGGGAYGCTLRRTILSRNVSLGRGGGASASTLDHCTVWGNVGAEASGVYGGRAVATIVCGNETSAGPETKSCTITGVPSGEPQFAYPEIGDFRLRAGSPFVGCGAVDEVVEGCLVRVAVSGPGAAGPALTIVPPGGSATVSVSAGADAFIGWTVGGADTVETRTSLTLTDVLSDISIRASFAEGLYVDGTAGLDSNDGRKPTTAKRTIQAAIDAASDGDTIHVSAGVYGPIDAGDKRVSIVSEDGVGKAVIDGKWKSRCVVLPVCDARQDARLVGFVVRRGYTSVSNNSSVGACGGVTGGVLERCLVTSCWKEGYYRNPWGCGVERSVCVDCVIHLDGEDIVAGMAAVESDLFGCTVYCEDVTADALTSGTAYNSILWGDVDDYLTCVNCCSPGGVGTKPVSGYPDFASPEALDFRLRKGSPCLDAGDIAYVRSSVDCAGTPRVQGRGVDIGAYEGGFVGLDVNVVARGRSTITPPGSRLFVPSGTVLTVSVDSVTRAYLGLSVDGEPLDPTRRMVTFTGTSEDAAMTLTVAFAQDVHVDAANGNDAWPGDSARPKKTLRAGVDEAVDGDTVFVAPGTYEQITTGKKSMTIIGTGGAMATRIIRPKSGSGPCVDMSDATDPGRMRIVGFTLENGSGGSYGGGGVRGGTAERCIIRKNRGDYGAGARDAVLHSCLVVGNEAYYEGGGAYGCTLYNCTVCDNKDRSSLGGGGACRSVLYNSIVLNNSGYTYSTDTKDIGYMCEAVNCISLPTQAEIDALKFAYAPDDYRPLAGSSCFEAGSNAFVTTELDLAGRPRVQGDRVDLGAYEGPVEGWLQTVKVKATRSGVVTPKKFFSAVGDVHTLTAEVGSREFLGWSTNGTDICSTALEFDYETTEAYDEVMAVFSSYSYVDAVNGNDGNDGSSPAKAKRTLYKAYTETSDDETLIAMPGTYENLDTYGLSQRKLQLIAKEGPARTFIDGKGMHRCIRFTKKSTTVIGFTLINGSSGSDGGGGVSGGGCLVGCCISNCQSTTGSAAARDADLINCLVVANSCSGSSTTTYDVGATAFCELWNCTLAYNRQKYGRQVTRCNLHNCVIVDPDTYYTSIVSSGTGYKNDNCLFYDSRNKERLTDFVDAKGLDFHPRAGALCINAATSANEKSSVDFDGKPRQSGLAVDQGCFEYQFTPPVAYILSVNPASPEEYEDTRFVGKADVNGGSAVTAMSWKYYPSGEEAEGATDAGSAETTSICFPTAGVWTVEFLVCNSDGVWSEPARTNLLVSPESTEIPVPPEYLDEFMTWLEENGIAGPTVYRKAKQRDACGRPVVEDFIAGVDPHDGKAAFRAIITVKDGKPVITWDPDLNADGAKRRTYTVFGNPGLNTQGWRTPTRDGDKFFKVDVSLP